MLVGQMIEVHTITEEVIHINRHFLEQLTIQYTIIAMFFPLDVHQNAQMVARGVDRFLEEIYLTKDTAGQK
jgi:hypothetical protein